MVTGTVSVTCLGTMTVTGTSYSCDLLLGHRNIHGHGNQLGAGLWDLNGLLNRHDLRPRLLHVRGLRNLLHDRVGNIYLLARIRRGRGIARPAATRPDAYAQKPAASKEAMATAAQLMATTAAGTTARNKGFDGNLLRLVAPVLLDDLGVGRHRHRFGIRLRYI